MQVTRIEYTNTPQPWLGSKEVAQSHPDDHQTAAQLSTLQVDNANATTACKRQFDRSSDGSVSVSAVS